MIESAPISVVIPARDEAARLPTTLRCVQAESPWEVIVVEGQSEDETARVAQQHGAVVVESEPGRGRQMNQGAAYASGEILLFLHADTTPPEGFVEAVNEALNQPGVGGGAFALRIDASQRAFRVIERMVRWRARYLQWPYGDQALFLRRSMFDALGGFPEYPVMEDFEFVRRLRKRGRIAIIDRPARTAPRRWLECGIGRTTFTNLTSAVAYRLGASPWMVARYRRWMFRSRAGDRGPGIRDRGSESAVMAESGE